ncbi:MAG: tRNA (adenosine(37)-N6)-threonylcarbamoyltransferase complex ATPase subunit type 1 TsaE, partial [Pseudomonadota bacterium]
MPFSISIDPSEGRMAHTRHTFSKLAEKDVLLLAEVFALAIGPGDLIALHGELGAGKSTFARGLIRALMRERMDDADPRLDDIPSPTFTLAQAYRDVRVSIMHFDLYRLGAPAEVHELGLDLALNEGAALIEWPENASGELPAFTFQIVLSDASPSSHADGTTTGFDLRQVEVSASDNAISRLARLTAAFDLVLSTSTQLNMSPQLAHFHGDASSRTYARIVPRVGFGADSTLDNSEKENGAGIASRPESALLMDWPAQPDGPPVKRGLPYSQIAHIAEDMRSFLGVAHALRSEGLAVPTIHGVDVDAGLMVLEDFGPRVFGSLVASGHDLLPLWSNAIDVLARLRAVRPPTHLTSPDFEGHVPLPNYDREALTIEVELLLNWYWPMAHGAGVSDEMRARFLAAWDKPFDL